MRDAGEVTVVLEEAARQRRGEAELLAVQPQHAGAVSRPGQRGCEGEREGQDQEGQCNLAHGPLQ